jgi:hypothetical protein
MEELTGNREICDGERVAILEKQIRDMASEPVPPM